MQGQEAVYGKQFLNGQSGQDIRIRHIAEINDNNLVECDLANWNCFFIPQSI